MANKKLHIVKLQIHFKGQNAIEKKDIQQFYKELEPAVKPATINWRVYSLVQLGVLSSVGRGKFILGKGNNFIPQVSYYINKLYDKLQKQFPYLSICIWQTRVLNELMLHQPGRFYTLVEVEKDAMENVFYFLKENKTSVFLDPTENILSHYAIGKKETVIVKPLASEAPMQNIKGVQTITIEKMLVDIFCDETIFASQQGAEMQNIFREAYDRYTIHESRMLRYADRRGRKESFDKYLNRVSKFRQQTK